MRGQLTEEQRLKQINTRLKNENERLRERNSALEKEVAELKEKLSDKEEQRKRLVEKMYKPNKNNDEKEVKKLGKKEGTKGFQRKKPSEEEITEEITFSLTQCPYCRGTDCLEKEPKEAKTVYMEDIVILPDKIVRKYNIPIHWCKICQEYVRSNKVPQIERIGPNVMAYILYARYRLRLPFNKIRQSLLDLHNFKISEGEISNQLEKAKNIFKEDHQSIIELIKISNTVYCDETGWRVKGKNFWIWVFVTRKGIRYAIEDTRGKGIAQESLGDNQNRVLISDFYGAYKNLPGENQYCWVHLMRDAKYASKSMLEDLKCVYEGIKNELAKETKNREIKRLDELLENISKKQYDSENGDAVRRLQKRISKTKKELLTCLKYEDVLPENNTAERALRNSVVMRKVFGCSRSVKSAKVMETNMTVIDTLLKQNSEQGFFQVILPRIKELRGV